MLENGYTKGAQPTGLCAAKCLQRLESAADARQVASLRQVKDALRAALNDEAVFRQAAGQLGEHLGDAPEVVPECLAEL